MYRGRRHGRFPELVKEINAAHAMQLCKLRELTVRVVRGKKRLVNPRKERTTYSWAPGVRTAGGDNDAYDRGVKKP